MINNTCHYHWYFPYCNVVVLELHKVLSNNDDKEEEEEREEKEESIDNLSRKLNLYNYDTDNGTHNDNNNNNNDDDEEGEY